MQIKAYLTSISFRPKRRARKVARATRRPERARIKQPREIRKEARKPAAKRSKQDV